MFYELYDFEGNHVGIYEITSTVTNIWPDRESAKLEPDDEIDIYIDFKGKHYKAEKFKNVVQRDHMKYSPNLLFLAKFKNKKHFEEYQQKVEEYLKELENYYDYLSSYLYNLLTYDHDNEYNNNYYDGFGSKTDIELSRHANIASCQYYCVEVENIKYVFKV